MSGWGSAGTYLRSVPNHFGLSRKSFDSVTKHKRVLHVHVCDHQREVQCTCILVCTQNYQKYMHSVHGDSFTPDGEELPVDP